jgi:hypothetical protein
MQALEVDARFEIDLHVARSLEGTVPSVLRIGGLRDHRLMVHHCTMT